MGRIVRENVFTLVNAIALGFLVLIAIAGAWNDAIFAAVIAVNAMIGIAQELSAKRKLDRIALLVAPRARVRRDGAEREIPAEDVVPDDIVELQPGDQIVADGVVAASSSLTLDESMLTGESDQVPKEPGDTVLSGRLLRRRRRAVPRLGRRRRRLRLEADGAGARRQAAPVDAAARDQQAAAPAAGGDGAARRRPRRGAAAARHRVPRGGADRDRRPHLDRPRGPGAARLDHVRGRRRAHRPRRVRSRSS